MKRILIYIALMAAALAVPIKGNDVGKLRPVQAVMVSKEEGRIVIRTDTEDMGVGEDVLTALENLKDTTPAIIYLDTAEFLLISEDALNEIEKLRGILRKNVRLCLGEGAVLRGETAPFLQVHGQLPQLKNWKEGMDLPVLTIHEKRLILSEKSEKTP